MQSFSIAFVSCKPSSITSASNDTFKVTYDYAKDYRQDIWRLSGDKRLKKIASTIGGSLTVRVSINLMINNQPIFRLTLAFQSDNFALKLHMRSVHKTIYIMYASIWTRWHMAAAFLEYKMIRYLEKKFSFDDVIILSDNTKLKAIHHITLAALVVYSH